MAGKTALVTGASSGIGEATARKLQALGFTVYAAARRLERMQGLAADGIAVMAMDVTDDASMRAGIERIIAEAGRIDVLVNNAGYGSYGALEDVEINEGRRQIEVNVFGAIRLVQLVLPHMRARGAGTIVNISSMGGRIHTPLGGWYHGTKFALEALSDRLRLEVRPFGIDVVVIEPGGIATEWGPIAGDLVEQASGHGPYGRQAAAVAKLLRGQTTGSRNSPPGVVADAVGRAVLASRPKTRYAVGFGAKPLILARRFLGDRLFDALITRATGMPRR